MKRAIPWLSLFAMSSTAFAQDIQHIENDLRAAAKKENVSQTEEKAKALLSFNTLPAAEALCRVLQWVAREDSGIVNNAIYWSIVKATASFSNDEPLEAVGKFIVAQHNNPVARDLMFMIQSNYSVSVVRLLVVVLESKANEEVRIMAVDHCGVLQHKDAVKPLINALKDAKSDEFKRRIGKALRAITGQDYGDSVTNWEGWAAANLDKLEAKGANKGNFSGQNVMTGLDRPREEDIERTKKLPPDAIVVITAGEHDPGETKRNGGRVGDHNFDHIERVLTKWEVPHIVVTKEEFEKGFNLDGRMMVLMNCNQWREHCVCPDCDAQGEVKNRLYQCKCKLNPPVHMNKPYLLSAAAVKRIKKFVDGGGYLFTEDWILEEVLQRAEAWPDLVKAGEYVMPAQVVPVQAKKGNTSHPYLRRIFARPPSTQPRGTGLEETFEEIKHQWQIDNESPKIKVLDDKEVVTLLVSPELGSLDAVAICFASGKGGEIEIGTGRIPSAKNLKGGRVMHVLSHFGKQKSEKDEYSIQNLLVNFLIEATERFGYKFPGKFKDDKGKDAK